MTEDQDMDGEGEYHDEDYEGGEDELFGDENADEEAEAVAKQLGDALWADISKAYAQQGAGQQEPPLTSDTRARLTSPRLPSPSLSEASDDEQTLVNAIQTVLEWAAGHASLKEVLSDIIVPGTQDQTLLHVLTEATGTKPVSPELADTLSTLVQTIADGEIFNAMENAVMHRDAEEENENGGLR